MTTRTGRRLGVSNSETRAALIEAAAQIVSTEGAAAVTAGRLASRIGLQRHIVHYYFGTIDDLLLAVFRRDSDRTREWLADALTRHDPLHVIWELGSRAASSVLEFSALATRSEAIRDEFGRVSAEFRVRLVEALDRYIEAEGVVPTAPPAAVAIAVQSIAYTLSIERLLGMDEGHAVMKASLHGLLGIAIDV